VKGFKKSVSDEKDEEGSVDSHSADSIADKSTTESSVEVKEKDKV